MSALDPIAPHVLAEMLMDAGLRPGAIQTDTAMAEKIAVLFCRYRIRLLRAPDDFGAVRDTLAGLWADLDRDAA